MKYTIWIIPPEPVYTMLKNIVHNLAEEFDGPIFEPHMTLLGNVEISEAEMIEKTRELAGKSAPLELSLGPVSFSTTYFQSVFVRVNSTAQLMQMNMDAKEIIRCTE